MLDCLQTFGCMLWALGRQAHDGFHEPTAYCNKIVILFAMYCIGQNPLQYTLGLHEPEVYWLKVKVKECLQAERHEMASFFSLNRPSVCSMHKRMYSLGLEKWSPLNFQELVSRTFDPGP